MSEHVLAKFKNIKAFFFDVDGVLTDGSVTLIPGGEQVRVMNIKDGYALQLAAKKNYIICIITGGRSQQVIDRMNGLGIHHVFVGVHDKLSVFEDFLIEKNLDANDCLYMGDDIPDYEVMRNIGLPTCPANACNEIKEISAYISPIKGGEGCVRDVIEKVLKLQGNWFNSESNSSLEGFTW